MIMYVNIFVIKLYTQMQVNNRIHYRNFQFLGKFIICDFT